MPRNYVKKPGTRNYANYSKETLEKCLAEVRNGLPTLQASQKFGIHRNTIANKMRGRHVKPKGRPVTFTEAEEECFAQYCLKMSEWGFPLDRTDLRYIVKAYLDKEQRVISRFKNNLPGDDWAKSFLQRQSKIVKEKMATNIKRSRANISQPVVNDFFDELGPNLESVPQSNIFNYDETNLSDDPGKKKAIVKRTSKYPERVMNSSKSNISLMFCGSASGSMIPPYVVYKSDHLYDTWTRGGPKGTRYNRSKSGWFDQEIFEDWFEKQFLPFVRRLEGPKVLIGDNVSSHISLRVVKLCEENNVKIIFLPANSTHLLQPLDVAFFGPLKKEWRKILSEWKSSAQGKNASSLDKNQFPFLLNKLITNCNMSSENMISGFSGTGIFPLDRNKVLQKLPLENVEGVNEKVSAVFLDHLKEMRYNDHCGSKQRKKRLDVAPGKSISAEDFQEASGSSTAKKKPRRQRDSSSEEEEIPKAVVPKKPTLRGIKTGCHVVVTYEGEMFPGKVLAVDKKKEEVEVLCMKKGLKNWKWPKDENAEKFNIKDIDRFIKAPIPVNKRGIFRVPELEAIWGS